MGFIFVFPLKMQNRETKEWRIMNGIYKMH